jgi:hypothetical protein
MRPINRLAVAMVLACVAVFALSVVPAKYALADDAANFYHVTRDFDTSKGDVLLNGASGDLGRVKDAPVRVTARAKSGYAVGKMLLQHSGGASYINTFADNEMTFNMPADKVCVRVEFGRPYTTTVKTVGQGVVEGPSDGFVCAPGRVFLYKVRAASNSVFQLSTFTNEYGLLYTTTQRDGYLTMPARDLTFTSYFAQREAGHSIS